MTEKKPQSFEEWSPLDVFLYIGESICRFYESGPDTAVYDLRRFFPQDGPEAFAASLPFAITALEVKQQEAIGQPTQYRARQLGNAILGLQIVQSKVRQYGEAPPIYPGVIDLRLDRTGDASHIINAHNYLAPPDGYQM